MLMRNQGQPIIDRDVGRGKINEDRERRLKKELR
jgi:polyhydroxyalkanoate synthesis regulator phasin